MNTPNTDEADADRACGRALYMLLSCGTCGRHSQRNNYASPYYMTRDVWECFSCWNGSPEVRIINNNGTIYEPPNTFNGF